MDLVVNFFYEAQAVISLVAMYLVSDRAVAFMTTISIKVEFSGGLELLFSNQRKYTVAIPAVDAANSKRTDLAYLIRHLRDNLLKEREELFVDKDTVYVRFFENILSDLICASATFVVAQVSLFW